MAGHRVDIDSTTSRAWVALREAWAERLLATGSGECVEIVVGEDPEDGDEDGLAPAVAVARHGDRFVARTPANPTLAARHRMDRQRLAALRRLGWQRAAGGDYRFVVDVRHVDQVAQVCVATLRDVHGVVHPAFLVGDVELVEDPALPRVTSAEPPSGPVAAYPQDADHLGTLVTRTLAGVFGHPPHVDEDGDVPVAAGSAVIFVHVRRSVPSVLLFAELVVGIEDTGRAAVEVEGLNRDHPLVKFDLRGDRIRMTREIDAWPFAPQHLRAALSGLCAVAEGIDQDVARRVRGRTFHPAGRWQGTLPPRLAELMGDTRALPVSVRPRVLAEICEQDPSALRQLLDQARQDRKAWREELDTALALKGTEAWLRTCRTELADARQRCRRIRRALHGVMVQRAGPGLQMPPRPGG